MECRSHSAGFMLQPHCSYFIVLVFVNPKDSGWASPLFTLHGGTLLSSEHDHVPDAVGPGDRSRFVENSVFDLRRAVEMDTIIAALVFHCRTLAKNGCPIHLITQAAEFCELFFLHECTGSPSELP